MGGLAWASGDLRGMARREGHEKGDGGVVDPFAER